MQTPLETRSEAGDGSSGLCPAPQRGAMQEQLACQQLQSNEDAVGEACSEAKPAAGAVATAEALSARLGSTPQRVWSFSAWFARQARSNDILLLTLELFFFFLREKVTGCCDQLDLPGQGYVQAGLRAGRGKPARCDPGRSSQYGVIKRFKG